MFLLVKTLRKGLSRGQVKVCTSALMANFISGTGWTTGCMDMAFCIGTTIKFGTKVISIAMSSTEKVLNIRWFRLKFQSHTTTSLWTITGRNTRDSSSETSSREKELYILSMAGGKAISKITNQMEKACGIPIIQMNQLFLEFGEWDHIQLGFSLQFEICDVLCYWFLKNA